MTIALLCHPQNGVLLLTPEKSPLPLGWWRQNFDNCAPLPSSPFFSCCVYTQSIRFKMWPCSSCALASCVFLLYVQKNLPGKLIFSNSGHIFRCLNKLVTKFLALISRGKRDGRGGNGKARQGKKAKCGLWRIHKVILILNFYLRWQKCLLASRKVGKDPCKEY